MAGRLVERRVDDWVLDNDLTHIVFLLVELVLRNGCTVL
jgi:hypothetical protein